jgi:hypothetical protein
MNDDILAERSAMGVRELLKSANGDSKALYKAMVIAETVAKDRDIPVSNEIILECLSMTKNIAVFEKKK